MEDRVQLYRDQANQWRWRRVCGENGEVLADSSEGYRNYSDCTHAARRVNRSPYLFQVDLADIDTVEIDTSQRVGEPQ